VVFNAKHVLLEKLKRNLVVVQRFKLQYHLVAILVKLDIGQVPLKYSTHPVFHVAKVDTIQFLLQQQNNTVFFVL
jgi:hypothetical protein